jgi:CheY-like chemotaxis protein
LILIVDDRSDSARLTEMALWLVDPAIRTETVFSGEQALAFLRTAPDLPVLILLDLNMPGMNGIETLIRIRAGNRSKAIPVVILTLSCLESDEEAARAAGANGFVHKPIKLQELCVVLEPHIQPFCPPNERR